MAFSHSRPEPLVVWANSISPAMAVPPPALLPAPGTPQAASTIVAVTGATCRTALRLDSVLMPITSLRKGPKTPQPQRTRLLSRGYSYDGVSCIGRFTPATG